MDIVEFPNDRTVISTENNGFAGGERDENLIDEELLETEIPLDAPAAEIPSTPISVAVSKPRPLTRLSW